MLPECYLDLGGENKIAAGRASGPGLILSLSPTTNMANLIVPLQQAGRATDGEINTQGTKNMHEEVT